MQNPKLNQEVKYVGGLFSELISETYRIVGIYPTAIDPFGLLEVQGNDSWNLIKKSRIDFELV